MPTYYVLMASGREIPITSPTELPEDEIMARAERVAAGRMTTDPPEGAMLDLSQSQPAGDDTPAMDASVASQNEAAGSALSALFRQIVGGPLGSAQNLVEDVLADPAQAGQRFKDAGGIPTAGGMVGTYVGGPLGGILGAGLGEYLEGRLLDDEEPQEALQGAIGEGALEAATGVLPAAVFRGIGRYGVRSATRISPDVARTMGGGDQVLGADRVIQKLIDTPGVTQRATHENLKSATRAGRYARRRLARDAERAGTMVESTTIPRFAGAEHSIPASTRMAFDPEMVLREVTTPGSRVSAGAVDLRPTEAIDILGRSKFRPQGFVSETPSNALREQAFRSSLRGEIVDTIPELDAVFRGLSQDIPAQQAIASTRFAARGGMATPEIFAHSGGAGPGRASLFGLIHPPTFGPGKALYRSGSALRGIPAALRMSGTDGGEFGPDVDLPDDLDALLEMLERELRTR